MVRPTTLVVTGIIFILMGIVVGWYAFPRLIHSKIEEAKQLKKGSENRKNWAKFPISLDFKIYIWNVTNPDAIDKGAKPVVEQVGPFLYKEWKAKTNFEDDVEQDTITFNMINNFYFDADETKPLTGNETIVIPHILILSLAQILLAQKPSALSMLNKGIPHLFGDPKSVFITTTPRELLFDGITVNCTKVKEFAANTLCDQIRANPRGLQAVDNDTFKFSVFGSKNNTPDTNSITIKRGMKNIEEVGQVVLYNGKPEMNYWDGPKCNEIKGSDTTIFAPFIDRKTPADLWSFGAEVCRSLKAVYKEPKTYKGIPGLLYTADLGDMSTDPDLKCYCPTNTTCLKKGAFDVTKCTGAPLILTLPHCFECDPQYLNMVTGYNPSVEKHGIYMTFEPITGNPVEGHRRLQFNIWLYNVSKITLMKDMSPEPVLMPLLWIDEGIELNDTLCTKVRHLLYRPIKIVNMGRYVMIALGVIMMLAAVFVSYQRTKLNPSDRNNNDNKTTITQVSPAY